MQNKESEVKDTKMTAQRLKQSDSASVKIELASTFASAIAIIGSIKDFISENIAAGCTMAFVALLALFIMYESAERIIADMHGGGQQ